MRIMMSAAGSPVAPSIMRHLRDLGHDVVGHDSNGFADIKSPRTDDQDRFTNFLGYYEPIFDLYLPFLDEELRKIAKWYGSPKIVCSPRETLEIFTSKIRQQRALGEADIWPVPLWKKGGVAICKPEFGRGGKDILISSDPSIIGRMRNKGYIAQKLIHGDEYTIDILTDRDGEFIFAVPRKRIQTNGVSVIGQIDMDDDLIYHAQRLTKEFKFAGPINMQMIRETGTGVLYTIEVNARLSGSCIFTVIAGFDILGATIKLWEGKPVRPPFFVRNGMIIKRQYIEREVCAS